MAEAADGEVGMGVVFVVAGNNLYGVPSPLDIEGGPVGGQAQSKRAAWAIMVPLPANPDSYPKGTKVQDTKGRNYKVLKTEEKRMALCIYVIDENR